MKALFGGTDCSYIGANFTGVGMYVPRAGPRYNCSSTHFDVEVLLSRKVRTYLDEVGEYWDVLYGTLSIVYYSDSTKNEMIIFDNKCNNYEDALEFLSNFPVTLAPISSPTIWTTTTPNHLSL